MSLELVYVVFHAAFTAAQNGTVLRGRRRLRARVKGFPRRVQSITDGGNVAWRGSRSLRGRLNRARIARKNGAAPEQDDARQREASSFLCRVSFVEDEIILTLSYRNNFTIATRDYLLFLTITNSISSRTAFVCRQATQRTFEFLWIKIHFQLRRFAEAEAALAEANRIDNRNASVWKYLCLLNMSLQRHDEYEQCFGQLVRVRSLESLTLADVCFLSL